MAERGVDENTPTLELPRALVEFILLGPEDDRRQLQDSPILGDVWLEFGRYPGRRLELLITPYKDRAAAMLAAVLNGDMTVANGEVRDTGDGDWRIVLADKANIAFLQGIVAASLRFDEVLGYVVPMTSWWKDNGGIGLLQKFNSERDRINDGVRQILEAARLWFSDSESERQDGLALMHAMDTNIRYTTLAGLILWASDHRLSGASGEGSTRERIRRILEQVNAGELVDRFRTVFKAPDFETLETRQPASPLVYTISLNRRASHALVRSIPAVKADAARTLFKVDCSEIRWAVLDSGIDTTHPALLDTDGNSRVERILDFTRIRDIVSLNNLRPSAERERRVRELCTSKLKAPLEEKDAVDLLVTLAQGAKGGRTVNWELVKPFIEITHGAGDPLASNHGTHVAGIIGASAESMKADAKRRNTMPDADAADGMCPDIKLYDVRVLGRTLKETEFAIIAALQYLRHINDLYSFITVHGANLSLSIPHDVRNYACGRTPICNECERLVNSGVVVVAAAGNRGYQNFETKEGVYEGYAAFSVTDPGNADGVITVGATHRYWPHTYGVSFFSSRGPTGDGRLKPDLVAPGEKIRATVPGGGWGDLDGTSMAAPHVSGAAAMLMARYSELVGLPRRIKGILTQSATDLGRERTFQGNGMLDVLRAFQSI